MNREDYITLRNSNHLTEIVRIFFFEHEGLDVTIEEFGIYLTLYSQKLGKDGPRTIEYWRDSILEFYDLKFNVIYYQYQRVENNATFVQILRFI